MSHRPSLQTPSEYGIQAKEATAARAETHPLTHAAGLHPGVDLAGRAAGAGTRQVAQRPAASAQTGGPAVIHSCSLRPHACIQASISPK
jgi:hypothetical protein